MNSELVDVSLKVCANRYKARDYLPCLGIAIIYYAFAELALLLAIPPGHATAVWPAAGFGVGCALIFRRDTALCGILVGSFLANLFVRFRVPDSSIDFQTIIVALGMALGASLQAGASSYLIVRYVTNPHRLNRFRTVLLTLTLAAPIGCCTNATIGSAIMLLSNLITPLELPFTWMTWWVGDSIGVLIVTPIILLWCDKTSHHSLSRKLLVTIPLLFTVALVVAVFILISGKESNRIQAEFNQQARYFVNRLRRDLHRYEDALHGTKIFFENSAHVTSKTFASLAAEQLKRYPGMWALSWDPIVLKEDRSKFQADLARDGALAADILEVSHTGELQPATPRDLYVPVKFCEPVSNCRSIVGVDVYPLPGRGDALKRAIRTRNVAVTSPLKLVQRAGGEASFLMYSPVFKRAEDSTPEGFVVSAFDIDQVVSNALIGIDLKHMQFSLNDGEFLEQFGESGFSWSFDPAVAVPYRNALDRLTLQSTLNFGGRTWVMKFFSLPQFAVAHRSLQSWVALVLGLVFTGLLGVFLTTVTGHASALQRLNTELEERVDARTRSLQTAHTLLSFHVENSPLAVVEWDRDFRIRMWSDSAEAIFGWRADEVIGKIIEKDFKFFFDKDTSNIELVVNDLLKGIRNRVVSQNRNLHRNGSVVECEWYNSTLLDDDGRVVSVMSLGLDVTERSSADRALRRQTEELREANTQAQQATEAKSRFLANISHEIRTPMIAIIGYSESIIQDHINEVAKIQAARKILTNASHLLDIINDLLDVSKIEAGKLSLEMVATDVGSLVREVCELHASRAAAKSIDIFTSIDECLPGLVETDPTRLRQILTNLVSNAIKFTESGHIEVSVRYHMALQRIKCTVSDTGIGLSDDDLSRLFEPFSQADLTITRRFGGTGLGLAISKELAERLGGTLSVASTRGMGSVFSFEINALVWKPPLSNVRDFPTIFPSVVHDSRIERNEICGVTVLLVDDGEDTTDIVSFILKRAHALIETCSDGARALDLLSRKTFDVVLMDRQMPGFDGLVATRKLRSLGYTAPIVAFSANVSPADVRESLAAGCNEHLGKPFTRAQLIDAIARQARKNHALTCASLSFPLSTLQMLESDPQGIRILRNFATTLADTAEELRACFARNDLERMRFLAHKTKGAASNLGLRKLSQLAEVVESCSDEIAIQKLDHELAAFGREAHIASEAILKELVRKCS